MLVHVNTEAVSGMGMEARAKLGCQLSSPRMVQRSRKAANRHPSNPRDLETLSIPSNLILSHNNEPMQLWDFGSDRQTRRSFLWGTPTNATDAELILWTSAGEDYDLIQEPVRGSGLLGTLPTTIQYS